MSTHKLDLSHKGWGIMLIMLVAAVVLGFVASLLPAEVTFQPGPWDKAADRLQIMLIVAVVIERAVEVYLFATDTNGPDRFNPDDPAEQARFRATRTAIIAALTLSILSALVGVRILESITLTAPAGAAGLLWTGVDVVISAGLLAGGSALIHEIAEMLRGGFQGVTRSMSNRNAARTAVTPGTTTASVTPPAAPPPASPPAAPAPAATPPAATPPAGPQG